MVTGMILQGGSHLKNIIAFPAKAGLLATFEAGGRSGSSSGSAGKVGGVRGEEEDALAACNWPCVFFVPKKASFDTLFWGGVWLQDLKNIQIQNIPSI